MKRFLQITCVTFISLSTHTTTQALAQELDANGQKLKSLFETLIDNQSRISEGSSISVNFEGDISVEQAGDYYAVTLPFLSLDYPDGSSMDIGLIGINAAQHDSPDKWKMTFALPAQMNYRDADAQTLFTVDIGAQRSSGVWSESLGYFSKLDANFENIVFENVRDGFTLNLPAARAVYDLDEDENKKWSGPIYFNLNDITANAPEVEGNAIEIGALDLNMELFKYDPAALQSYRTKLEEALLNQQSVIEGEQTVANSQQASELFTALIDLLGDGFTSEYQISNFKIKGSPSADDFNSMSFDNAHFGMDAIGFTRDNVDLNMRLGFDNFVISPELEAMAALAPSNVNLDLSLANIPFSDITELGMNTFESGAINPGMAAMSLAFKLPAILSQAETTLLIEDNYYGNEMYHVDLDGAVKTDLTAAHSATADIKAQVRGMDAVIAYLSDQAGQADAPVQQLQQTIATLTMLKGLAAAGVNDAGDPTHNFDVALNKEGKIFLNGQDMTMMMGLLGGMAGPAATGGAVPEQTPRGDQASPEQSEPSTFVDPATPPEVESPQPADPEYPPEAIAD